MKNEIDENDTLLAEANELRREELDLERIRVRQRFVLGITAICGVLLLVLLGGVVHGLSGLDLPWALALGVMAWSMCATSFICGFIGSVEKDSVGLFVLSCIFAAMFASMGVLAIGST